MPGILLAISQNSEVPADRAAMFASTELCGMLASILFIGKLLNSKHRKTILVFAMVAIIVGNFASVFVYKSNVLLLARLLAGIGQGVAVAALGDRKSVVWGESVTLRVELGGRRHIKK